ncbi:ATP-binding protein [Candidatus Aerophobetes bacterium]|nr:ATP-binding protein [Candidatus Aerophobetes bacterium]
MREEEILTIPVMVDKTHIITIGEQLYGESVELGNNAYDADATRVDIRVYDRKIVVEDKGSGMDLEGLKQYFNIGSPHKRLPKKSPRFARDALAACRKFEVWTKKENFCGVVIFDKKRWEKSKRNWSIPLRLLILPPEKFDGTKVALLGLAKKFRIEDIKACLRETVPLSAPDFSVYHGKKLPLIM